MIPAERHKRIVDLVNERGSIRVAEISELFDVTEETARRDLDRLEAEGRLKRSHGGAVRLDDEPGEISYAERERTHSAEKAEVARLAVQFINPGDRIILDASSTAWYLARLIPDMPLTVLTNSVRVTQELAAKERMEVISTGGLLRGTSMSFIGPQAEEILQRYHVNKAFVSCKGVHLEYGISEASVLQGLIKQRMIETADEVYLIVDHSKFGVRDFSHVASLAVVDTIVTDGALSDHQARTFEQAGIRVVRP